MVADAVAARFELLPSSRVSDRRRGLRHVKLHTAGALYSGEGRLIGLSLRKGGIGGDHVTPVDIGILPADQMTQAAAHRKPGRFMYLGYHMNHYGHFITEGLSRLWLTGDRPTDVYDGYLVYPFIFNDARVVFSPFHQYFFELLGLPHQRIQTLQEPAQFESVTVPEQLWTVNEKSHLRMRDLYGRVRERHVGVQPARRVFLSRPPGAARRHPRAALIESIFDERGFDIIYPEQLPIETQMDIYANCSIMAGFSGSALHNCLFARPGILVLEVGDERTGAIPLPMQQNCNELAQVKSVYFGYTADPDGIPRLAAFEETLDRALRG